MKESPADGPQITRPLDPQAFVSLPLGGGGNATGTATVAGADRALWFRWVGANTLGEAVGLGLTALVAVGVAGAGDSGRTLLVAGAALALVAAGAVEGLAVGYAQWRVLRGPLAALRARDWVVATVVGALVAWTLGMLPTTVAGMGGASDGEPPFGDTAQYLLAAALGLLLGPVLGIPQWRVLRRFVRRAGWWVAANALAWAAGMPLIFLVAGTVPAGASVPVVAAAVFGACAGAGAVVGAVHGLWLVWLLRAGGHPRADGGVAQKPPTSS